jgi:hypothetical protein
MRTDRQTDMTKLIEAFRYSTNAPKNTVCLHANSLQQDPLFVKKKLRLSETSEDNGEIAAYLRCARKPVGCLHANSLQQDPLFVKKNYDSPKRRKIMAQRHVVTSQKSCIFNFF